MEEGRVTVFFDVESFVGRFTGDASIYPITTRLDNVYLKIKRDRKKVSLKISMHDIEQHAICSLSKLESSDSQTPPSFNRSVFGDANYAVTTEQEMSNDG